MAERTSQNPKAEALRKKRAKPLFHAEGTMQGAVRSEPDRDEDERDEVEDNEWDESAGGIL